MEETPTTRRSRAAKALKATKKTRKNVRRTTKNVGFDQWTQVTYLDKDRAGKLKDLAFPPGADKKTSRLLAYHGFVSIQSRGTLALPPALRKRYGLDKPGSQVEITEREDGVLELRPAVAVPTSEAWFWDERWQAGEREVDANYAAGQFDTFADAEDFMEHLTVLDAEASAGERSPR
jgi:bifunctional DNA-binding transcriptional regulator/antitoxin component of YhaV-PrlF toxin-antitoxin module